MLCLDLIKKKEKKKNQTNKPQTQPDEIKPNKEAFQLTWSTAGKCFLGQNMNFISYMLVQKKWSASQHKQVQTRLDKQLKKHAQVTLLLPAMQPLSLLGSAKSGQKRELPDIPS